jgi:glycosyltransferase involved in cell wall biosynthesis
MLPTAAQRLIYIARSPVPSDQANSIQVAKMCAGFARHIEVEMVAPRRTDTHRPSESLWDRYAVPRSFRATQLPYPHWGDRFAVRGYALTATWYARLRGFSLAYTRDPWVAYWLARTGVRTGFEAHDLAEDNRYPIWKKLVGGGSDLPGLRGIFCISRSLMQDYQAAGARPDLLVVAPDGVDLERFTPEKSKAEARLILGIETRGAVICHCGHLYPGRGGEELIEAISEIPDAQLILVGGTSQDIHRVHQLAQARGLADRIQFEGMVPNARVPLYLWAADVLAMPYTSRVPTLRAMSPLKMFEYLAARRPIVATDFPAIREILHDTANAVLVAPDSAHTLADGIRRILHDPDAANRMAAQARQDVEAYTWERRARKVLDELQR